jgi:hypothetical protein
MSASLPADSETDPSDPGQVRLMTDLRLRAKAADP